MKKEKAVSRLKVGDLVFAKAFTDSYGKFHLQVDLLKVTSIQYIDNEVAPHWRAKAIGANGFQWEEGCQDHFGLYSEIEGGAL